MNLVRRALAAPVLTAACTSLTPFESAAQTLTIGVHAGPESIDPYFTATGTHAEALKHVFVF